MPCDLVHLGYVAADGSRVAVAAFDGRFLAAETACSFSGRVVGVYCVEGELTFSHYRESASSLA